MDPRPLQQQLAETRAAKDAAWLTYKQAREARDNDLKQIQESITAMEAELRQAQQQAQTTQQPELAQPIDGQPVAWGTDGALQFQQLPQAPDPSRIAELESRIESEREAARQQGREWERSLWQSWQEFGAASKQVSKAEAQLAEATRRSPIDGVVAEVDAKQGNEIAACTPIVRVEDPAAFRVVTMVDEKVRRLLNPGALMPVQIDAGRLAGVLERVQDGWDKQEGQYYLWIKPDQPQRLLPGQQVEVEVPSELKLVASR